MIINKSCRHIVVILVLLITSGIIFLPPSIHAANNVVKIELMSFKLNDSEAIAAVLKEAAKGFEKENPGVKVELVPVVYEQKIQQLITRINANDPPDVVAIEGTDLGGLLDVLQPVEPLLKKIGKFDEIYNHLPKEFVDAVFKQRGVYYALPHSINPQGLTYNKKMFADAGLDPNAPPKTREELLSYAKKLTNPPRQYGYAIFGAKSGSTPRRWYRDFWDAGTEWVSRDYKRAMCNTPEAVEAVKFHVELATKYHVTPPGPVSADWQFVSTAFANENVAMLHGGVNNVLIFENIKPGMKKYIGIAPQPNTGAAEGSCGAYVIPYNAKNPLLAAKLVAYLNSKEMNVKYALGAYLPPARIDARKDPRILAEPLLTFSVPDKHLHPPYVHPKKGQWENILYETIQSMLLQEKTVEQALDDAAIKLNKLLQQ